MTSLCDIIEGDEVSENKLFWVYLHIQLKTIESRDPGCIITMNGRKDGWTEGWIDV